MSGCGEGGAQEGVHISRVGFLQEAGGIWKLEREQVLSDGCGVSQTDVEFPRRQDCSSNAAFCHLDMGFRFHKATG